MMTPEQQSRYDKLEITLRPVVNGWLIKRGGSWHVAKADDEALKITGGIMAEYKKMLLADLKKQEVEP